MNIARGVTLIFCLLTTTLSAEQPAHHTVPLATFEQRDELGDVTAVPTQLPQVRILAKQDAVGDHTLIVLECLLINHLDVPIEYHGHSVRSRGGGWISPRYRLETRERGESEWSRATGGGGGTGSTTMHVPAQHVGRFRISVPLSKGQVRVGVECGWSMDGERRGKLLWSDASSATTPNRRPAIVELAKRRDLAALIQALRSKDLYVRLEAARGLTWLATNARDRGASAPSKGSQELAAALATALNDPDHRVRHEATTGLVQLGSVQTQRALRLAAEDTHGDVRLIAVTALSYLDDPESRATLRKAAADDEHKIRWIAVNSMDGPHAAASLDVLLRAIEDRHPQVRAAAARVLGNVDQPPSIAALKQAMTDAAAPVRRNAAESLRRLDIDAGTP